MRPKVVLFDLDDTLCDYNGARVSRLRGAFSLAFSASGVENDDLNPIIIESIAIHPHGSDHFGELLTRHGVVDPDAHREARRWYHHHRFLGLNLFPDALPTLDRIRQMPGVRALGLITNGPADIQRDKIALLDLQRHIDFAVISGELGVDKPDPAIFAEALRLGGVVANQAVYIGDSPELDIAGARASGIPAIWMNRTGAPWPCPPDPLTVTSLTDLARLLSPG